MSESYLGVAGMSNDNDNTKTQVLESIWWQAEQYFMVGGRFLELPILEEPDNRTAEHRVAHWSQ